MFGVGRLAISGKSVEILAWVGPDMAESGAINNEIIRRRAQLSLILGPPDVALDRLYFGSCLCS